MTEEAEAFVLQRFISGDERTILHPLRCGGSALDITQSHGLALLPPALVYQSSPPFENNWKIWTRYWKVCVRSRLRWAGESPLLGTCYVARGGLGKRRAVSMSLWYSSNHKSPGESCLCLLLYLSFHSFSIHSKQVLFCPYHFSSMLLSRSPMTSMRLDPLVTSQSSSFFSMSYFFF